MCHRYFLLLAPHYFSACFLLPQPRELQLFSELKRLLLLGWGLKHNMNGLQWAGQGDKFQDSPQGQPGLSRGRSAFLSHTHTHTRTPSSHVVIAQDDNDADCSWSMVSCGPQWVMTTVKNTHTHTHNHLRPEGISGLIYSGCWVQVPSHMCLISLLTPVLHDFPHELQYNPTVQICNERFWVTALENVTN